MKTACCIVFILLLSSNTRIFAAHDLSTIQIPGYSNASLIRVNNPVSFLSTKKKNSIFKKIQINFLQKKLTQTVKRVITQKQKRQARLSMILGLVSFVFLFLPYLTWVALPLAIVGLIFGIKSVNGNSNIEGVVGIVASGITLSIFLIVAIVWATVMASGF